jgi:hypothetical protein
MFVYPISYYNWRNISTIYVDRTRVTSNEIFSPSKKIHGEVGRAKDLSAPRYLRNTNILWSHIYQVDVSAARSVSNQTKGSRTKSYINRMLNYDQVCVMVQLMHLFVMKQ